MKKLNTEKLNLIRLKRGIALFKGNDDPRDKCIAHKMEKAILKLEKNTTHDVMIKLEKRRLMLQNEKSYLEREIALVEKSLGV